jgi:hypothetical protein
MPTDLPPDPTLEQLFAQHLDVPGLTHNQADQLVDMGLGGIPASLFLPSMEATWPTRNDVNPFEVDIKHTLQAFLPPHIQALMLELQSIVNRLGVSAYVIGGIPRDLLMSSDRGLDIQDVDITLEGYAPDWIEQWLTLSQNFTCEAVYPDYGTATLRYRDEVTVDVASTRQERYTSVGAMPTVVALGVPLAVDLLRRDFSINTLALSLNQWGMLIDALDLGLKDLDKGLIRVLSPISFFEDPTRLIRALRFASRFNFRLGRETERLAQHWWTYAPSVYKGGGERVALELRRLLINWIRHEDGVPEAAIERALQLAVFNLMDTHQCPSQPPDTDHLLRQCVQLHHAYNYLDHWPGLLTEQRNDLLFQIWLCWLVPFMGNPEHTLSRLSMDKVTRQAVLQYQQLVNTPPITDQYLSTSPDAKLYKQFKGLPLATILARWLDSRRSDKDNLFDEEGLVRIQHYWLQVRQTSSLLDGDTLTQLGIPEGEMIGQLKQALILAQLNGQITDVSAAIAFVHDWRTLKLA